jgi:lipopolysaccharide cholinephosphotransferase
MYKESNIREIQMLELKILKAVVELCDKHNICYYISCGTLLGAVRHKGFIPWDNDVDIEMPIKDYKRFLRIAKKELPDYLFLKTYKTCNGYNEMWAKIGANGTTSLPLIWKKWEMHWGISLDIFPLTGLYENKILKAIQCRLFNFCRTLLAKEYVMAICPNELDGNRKLQFLYKIPRSVRTFICTVISHLIMKDPYSSKQLSMVAHNLNYPIDSIAYEHSSKLMFEDSQFNVPANYDCVLTALYGDYMTPPPESEQIGHELYFGKVIYSCETDYKEVLAELNRSDDA